jgi:hypothetical protein
MSLRLLRALATACTLWPTAAGPLQSLPEPCLIDWEFTRLGDPADETAYTLDQNVVAPSLGYLTSRIDPLETLLRMESAS